MTAKTFEELLDEWIKVKREAKRLSDLEMTMRNALFKAAFPNPKEGANKIELVDGRRLTATHKINRSVDDAAVKAVMEEMRQVGDNEIVPEDVFVFKADLRVGPYKKLKPKLQKIAAKAVTEKPGSPTLEVS